MSTHIPQLPLQLPDGSALPPPPKAALRPHTGTRFWADNPEAKAAAIELLKEGLSLSEIAVAVGPMCGKSGDPDKDNGIRKHLQALCVLERIDRTEAARYRFAVLRDEAADRMLDVVPHATRKELGALSMVATQAHQIERTLGGEANVVVEHRVTGLPTFAQLKEEARRALLQEQSTTFVEAEVLTPTVREETMNPKSTSHP